MGVSPPRVVVYRAFWLPFHAPVKIAYTSADFQLFAPGKTNKGTDSLLCEFNRLLLHVIQSLDSSDQAGNKQFVSLLTWSNFGRLTLPELAISRQETITSSFTLQYSVDHRFKTTIFVVPQGLVQVSGNTSAWSHNSKGCLTSWTTSPFPTKTNQVQQIICTKCSDYVPRGGNYFGHRMGNLDSLYAYGYKIFGITFQCTCT